MTLLSANPRGRHRLIRERPTRSYTQRLSVRLGLLLLAMALCLTPFSFMPSRALTAAGGDGVMFYGNASTTPQWRTYSGANNSFGAATGAIAGAIPRASKIVTSPTQQEAIGGYIDSAGTLRVVCYNGTSWTNEWSVVVGGTGTTQRFDIAYEKTTGDAMVVYSANVATTNELAYRTKPGANACNSGWSGANVLNPVRTSGTVLWVRLEASPVTNSNTIALAWSDSNSDLSAMQWTGASFAIAEPAAVLEANLESASAAGDVRSFDIAVESTSGDLMIAWGVSTTTTACTAGSNCMRSAQYVAAWSAVAAIPTVADGATSIDISANPNTNEIVLGAIDNGTNTTNANDLSIGYWSGTAWTGRANQDTATAAPVAGTQLVTTGWLINGATTRSIVAFNDSATTTVGYFAGNGSTYTAQTAFAPTPALGNPQKWYDIQTDPFFQDRLLFSISDTNADLFAKRLTMSSTGTFSWTNADGGAALEASLGQAITSPFSFAYWRFIPTTSYDNQALYGEGAQASPKHRWYQQGTNSWAAESTLPTNNSATTQVIMKRGPTRDEMIAGVVNSSGELRVYRWNGSTSSWSSQWSVTVGGTHMPRFDIAYEQNSGDAMVMYSRNVGSSAEIGYRMWNGTSWTGETTYNTVNTTGDVVDYIILRSRPGIDEIAMAWVENSTRWMATDYWTGSAWQGSPSLASDGVSQIDTGVSSLQSPSVDMAFESLSGRLILVFGEPTSSFYMIRSAGPAGTFDGGTNGATFTMVPQALELASRPGTDQISYINHSNYNKSTGATTPKAEVSVWNGTAWATPQLAAGVTLNAPAKGSMAVGNTWLTSGANARVLYTFDTTSGSGVDYMTYNPATSTLSSPAQFATSPAPPNSGAGDSTHKLYTHPGNPAEARLMMVDVNNDLYAKKITFDGTNVSFSSIEPSGVVVENDISNSANTKGWAVDFDYGVYTPPPGSLQTDIVDSGGSSVASPSVSVASAVVNPDCQTTTGTFGTSSQKIRISNTTLVPGWALSIAATGGATANWSSGLATYDFNDSSGSPAGCGDGGDGDSIAGQLSVDPSVGIITPQSGCSSTGVTKGSASAFAQGTTDNVTLMNGSGSAETNCYWDFTGVGLSQKIPASQPAGAYSVNMTITVVAN